MLGYNFAKVGMPKTIMFQRIHQQIIYFINISYKKKSHFHIFMKEILSVQD